MRRLPRPIRRLEPSRLSTIEYRTSDFSGFRRALLQPLPDEQALLGWHPAPGDLGLQLLEWWAYLADILTFYNERIANEDYLRTAELPASVTNLVALLGYTPRPAIAAVGQVAAIRRTTRPHEPVVIPAGMQIASTASPGVPVETFEAAAASFSGASNGPIVLQPTPALLTAPGPGESGIGSVLLRGSVSGLAAGDELVVIPRDATAAAERWAQVTVLASTREPAPSGGTNTRLALTSDEDWWLGGFAAADARVVRVTRSSPLWTPQGGSDPALSTDKAALRIRLASVERGIAPGDVAFLDFGGSDGLIGFKVTGTSDEFLGVPYPGATGDPPSPPDIAVLHTVLTAETPYAAWIPELSAAGNVTFRFGLRDAGTPIGSPATTLDTLPATVTAPGGFAIPAGGTRAFVEQATGGGIAVIATDAAGGAISLAATDGTPAEFSLAEPLQLLLDLVDVSRGTTVSGELLGTGDASAGGQSFALAKSPLTYLASAADWASTLSIAVDAHIWTEAETFYAQPGDAQIYVVSQQPDDTSRVRFGDGTNGARLPTGSRVVATYRYGAGAASPPAGRLTTILKPQANLASIHNPVAVWGGAEAQQADDVRTNAPASVLTFGRAISADDYETVAAIAPGVTRARAYWTWDGGRQRALVKVYAGDDAGAATAARNALAGAEDPNRPVAVVQATPINLTIACTLEISPDMVADAVASAAGASLTVLFAPATMGIGRPLYTSEVEAALSVEGVVAVHGLSATAGGGGEIFSGEPVGWADPGEGAFYVLATSSITPVVANG